MLPRTKDRGDGLIINVSSWAGRHDSYVAGPAYGASKHAVLSMSATIKLEEGRYGVRCCSLEPAEIATEILDQRPIPVSDEEQARMLHPMTLKKLFVLSQRCRRMYFQMKYSSVLHGTDPIWEDRTGIPVPQLVAVGPIITESHSIENKERRI